jgi:hypothetical protein
LEEIHFRFFLLVFAILRLVIKFELKVLSVKNLRKIEILEKNNFLEISRHH